MLKDLTILTIAIRNLNHPLKYKEYVKVCRKAEKNSKLNHRYGNFDCEGMLDHEDNTLQLMTDWYKDAMKNGEFNWSKYEKYLKRK